MAMNRTKTIGFALICALALVATIGTAAAQTYYYNSVQSPWWMNWHDTLRSYPGGTYFSPQPVASTPIYSYYDGDYAGYAYGRGNNVGRYTGYRYSDSNYGGEYDPYYSNSNWYYGGSPSSSYYYPSNYYGNYGYYNNGNSNYLTYGWN